MSFQKIKIYIYKKLLPIFFLCNLNIIFQCNIVDSIASSFLKGSIDTFFQYIIYQLKSPGNYFSKERISNIISSFEMDKNKIHLLNEDSFLSYDEDIRIKLEKIKKIIIEGILKKKDSFNVLLYGTSGTGKTAFFFFLIKNILGSTKNKIKIYNLSGSRIITLPDKDAILFLNTLFNKTIETNRKKNIITFIFIDECDVLLSKRNFSTGEPNNLINKISADLLTYIRKDNKDVYIIATTNKIEDIDESFLQRFSSKIKIGNPNVNTVRRIVYNFFVKELKNYHDIIIPVATFSYSHMEQEKTSDKIQFFHLKEQKNGYKRNEMFLNKISFLITGILSPSEIKTMISNIFQYTDISNKYLLKSEFQKIVYDTLLNKYIIENQKHQDWIDEKKSNVDNLKFLFSGYDFSLWFLSPILYRKHPSDILYKNLRLYLYNNKKSIKVFFKYFYPSLKTPINKLNKKIQKYKKEKNNMKFVQSLLKLKKKNQKPLTNNIDSKHLKKKDYYLFFQKKMKKRESVIENNIINLVKFCTFNYGILISDNY
jgi:hypothetical protein